MPTAANCAAANFEEIKMLLDGKIFDFPAVSLSAVPSNQQRETIVSERLPRRTVSNRKAGVFKRLRINAIFVFISSINPSLGPLTAMSVGGSIIARTGKNFAPTINPTFIPSTSNKVFPSSISLQISVKSDCSFNSGKSTVVLIFSNFNADMVPSFCLFSFERSNFDNGRAMRSPSSCLFTTPSA